MSLLLLMEAVKKLFFSLTKILWQKRPDSDPGYWTALLICAIYFTYSFINKSDKEFKIF